MSRKNLQEYAKSINPQEDQQAILIYGSIYKLWRDGHYIGEAIWTQDENVGDSFQVRYPSDKEGYTRCDVFVADKWELIPKK